MSVNDFEAFMGAVNDSGDPSIKIDKVASALCAASIFFQAVTELYEKHGDEGGISFDLAGLAAVYGGYIDEVIKAYSVKDVDRMHGASMASHFAEIADSIVKAATKEGMK